MPAAHEPRDVKHSLTFPILFQQLTLNNPQPFSVRLVSTHFTRKPDSRRACQGPKTWVNPTTSEPLPRRRAHPLRFDSLEALLSVPVHQEDPRAVLSTLRLITPVESSFLNQPDNHRGTTNSAQKLKLFLLLRHTPDVLFSCGNPFVTF